jgi:periplasmic protein TonB
MKNKTKTPPLTPLFQSLGVHTALVLVGIILYTRSDLFEEPLPVDIIEIKRAAIGNPNPGNKPKEKKPAAPVAKSSQPAVASTSSTAPSTPAVTTDASSETTTGGVGPISEEFEVNELPVLVGEVRIPYPEDSKSKGIEGVVLMDLVIDVDGRVRKIDLIQSPAQDLAIAATGAAQRFRFKAARVGEKAVNVKIRYAYRFVLE